MELISLSLVLIISPINTQMKQHLTARLRSKPGSENPLVVRDWHSKLEWDKGSIVSALLDPDLTVGGHRWMSFVVWWAAHVEFRLSNTSGRGTGERGHGGGWSQSKCLRKRARHGKPESPVPLLREQRALSEGRAADRNERWQRIHFTRCFSLRAR